MGNITTGKFKIIKNKAIRNGKKIKKRIRREGKCFKKKEKEKMIVRRISDTLK